MCGREIDRKGVCVERRKKGKREGERGERG
jgi:hypothetical protein